MRSVRDIDNNKRRRYLYYIPLSTVTANDEIVAAIPPPVECHPSMQWRLPSPSGAKIAILRTDKPTASSSADEPQILEIWVEFGHALERRIRLPTDHGTVISDPGGFGRPCWNADETALVYSAERKAPLTLSFFDDSPDSKPEKTQIRGGQNELGTGKMESWGEKYSKQSPLLDLYCVHVETGKVAKVENVPGNAGGDSTLGGFTLGEPIFSPRGETVVYVAWDAGGGLEMPRRLGLVYCQQRPSKIYASSVKHLMNRLSSVDDKNGKQRDDDFELLSPELKLARSPRFTPGLLEDENTTLVFLGSKNGFDTHSGCFALYALEWRKSGESYGNSRVVVEEVWDPRQSSDSIGEASGMRFPGLFLQQLPESLFVSPNYLLVTTQWGSTTKLIRVSLSNGEVTLLPCDNESSSSALVCVAPDGGAIVNTQSPNSPGLISLIPFSALSSESLSRQSIKRHALISMMPVAATRFSKISLQALPLTYSIDIREPPQVEGVEFDLPIQSLLLLPDGPNSSKPPLIVVPHGGPHSSSCSSYIPSYAFLCGYGGYAILMVNYRGSTGFGQGCIEALPTRIGHLDVEDVVSVTKQVRDSGLVDTERIGICGGSHGGFLTGHCTAQYPNLFKAAAMRNPVCNIPSMTSATDSKFKMDLSLLHFMDGMSNL
jgi:acylaminoacyl-peptidase